MLRPRFFTASLPDPGAEASLEKEPSRHIGKALRMRAGDRLCLFDGSGRECAATISAVERDNVRVVAEAAAEIDRESRLHSILAVALSRGDRMDTVVQKATELGVSEIWPLISERTGVRLAPERLHKKCEHWRRIAVSACEQCGRNRIPDILAAAPLDEVLARDVGRPTLRLLMHPDVQAHGLPAECASVLMLVGPEGGFSPGEVSRALETGFTGLSLGPRVLRTETAPLTALSVAQARWGDFLRP